MKYFEPGGLMAKVTGMWARSSNGPTTSPRTAASPCGMSPRRTPNGSAPARSSFMINYRIDNMVEILAGPESHENGKLAWMVDPDGNKVELWEPMPWDETKKAK